MFGVIDLRRCVERLPNSQIGHRRNRNGVLCAVHHSQRSQHLESLLSVQSKSLLFDWCVCWEFSLIRDDWWVMRMLFVVTVQQVNRFFNTYYQQQMDRSDRVDFLNLWHVLIITTDVLVVCGTVFKVLIQCRVRSKSPGSTLLLIFIYRRSMWSTCLIKLIKLTLTIDSVHWSQFSQPKHTDCLFCLTEIIRGRPIRW